MQGSSSCFIIPRVFAIGILFSKSFRKVRKISDERDHRKKKEHRNNCDEIAILFLLIHGFVDNIGLIN